MSDAVSENLSAFVDGELHPEEQWGVLNRMQADNELRERYERYQLISDALRNNLPAATLHGLAGRVSLALEDEPVILAPRVQKRRMQPLIKQAAGMAVAATIATVAILSLHTSVPEDTLNGGQVAQTRTTANEVAAVGPMSLGVAAPVRLVSDTSDVQARLNRYLVNHNEYSVASGMQGMMPYMRIVSYPSSDRAVNENR